MPKPGPFDDLKAERAKVSAPGIPGTHLPPRGAIPPPLPPVHARARAATQAGMPAPPAPRGAPEPPPAPSLPPVAQTPPEPPRSITPGRLVATGLDKPETLQRAREAVQKHGQVIEDPPESLPTTRGYVVEPPPWRTAKGLAGAAAVITATAGLVAALSAGIVQIIKAVREPSEGAKVKDIADAKKAGEECQAAVASERKATLAREEALATRISEAEKKTSEVARSVPAVKADPMRAPKP